MLPSHADQTWIEHVERQSGGSLRIRTIWSGALLAADQSMIELRHDHGSQYLTDFFQSNARFHGFAPSFALLGEPETNGVVERFHRTLKEQIIHGRSYQNLAQLRAAVATFIHTYNHHWRLEKLRYQSPIQARLAFYSAMPLAA